MKQRQLELWDDGVVQDRRLDNSAVDALSGETRQTTEALVRDPVAYTSLKRVSLIHEGSIQTRPALTSTAHAKRFFANYWVENPGNDQEKFVVACLDTKNRVQCVVVVTVGTLDASLIHPREVFKPAIIEGSSAVVLSHNHPSGDTTPSKEDRAVTDRLTEAGELLGITVLDHIIHGDCTNEVLSIRDA
jgi:DNA repair protein RadC